eukprot:TRINITY_DN2816_c7_g1_i1.p1 TRINITY_DN2816_c7_g1~~TRINITY_DN2816_c7_g1_i1.p1  ORF type:complete len:208 (-),score=20.25 TRINITY_DN2816_c7_g1_i1:28-651(-)
MSDRRRNRDSRDRSWRERDNRNRRRSRSRSRSRSGGRARRPRSPPRIPPPRPTPRQEEPEVTLEQRQNSVECNGYLYATLSFTPKEQPPDTPSPEQRFGIRGQSFYNSHYEESVPFEYAKVPAGWEMAEVTDDVIEKVIKPYPWGTHVLVSKDNKAYQTSEGNNAGGLQMLWDFDKHPNNGYRLTKKVGMSSKWHGRILIRTKFTFK